MAKLIPLLQPRPRTAPQLTVIFMTELCWAGTCLVQVVTLSNPIQCLCPFAGDALADLPQFAPEHVRTARWRDIR